MKWALGLIAVFSAGALSASAHATVLYSLSGTVGDSNWFEVSPGEYVLSGGVNLPSGSPPPGFTGSYGVFYSSALKYNFKFSTAGVVVSSDAFDDLLVDGGEIVVGPLGGGPFSAYGGSGFDGGGSVDTTNTLHGATFQVSGSGSSEFSDGGYVIDDVPPDAPFGSSPLTGELVYYTTLTSVADVGWDVAAMGLGDPFSISVYSSVPEPETWALMILGFVAIGARMRRRRYAT
jgi:hypothetical protein